MTDLTTIPPSSMPSAPISPRLSEGLTALLDSEGSPDDAAREIGSYLAYREEAREALPALRAVAEWKAGEVGVRAVIGRRFALYPQPPREDGEWAAWWADYFDCLADVPLACLEAAMRAWVARADAQFMPKPGELRDLAHRTPSRSLKRYQRAKRALMLADQPTPPPALIAPEGVHVDTAAEVKRMLAEYREVTATAKKIPDAPSISGKPDERGITDEMRRVLARQRGVKAAE